MHFSDGIRAQPAALARSAAAVTAALADLALGTGLGGVVVVDGRPLPRAHGAAGEIGFLLADRGQLRRPGLMGMEERVGGRVVADCARRLAAEQPDRTVLDPRSAETAHVFPAAPHGDALAQRLVDEVVEHLAMTIVDVAAVLDPERIVLDGSIGKALEPFLPRLVDLVAPAVLYPPEICVSTLAPSAALVGAVHEAWRLVGG